MWIVYVLSFLFGGGVAWAVSKMANVVGNRFHDHEFGEKIGDLTLCTAFLSVLISTAIMCAVAISLTNKDEEHTERIERLEERVKNLEKASQRDTVFIYRALDGETQE